MTAANIFARQHGIFLFSDTAVFDDYGVITEFESKVITDERLGMAIGRCGRFNSSSAAMIAEFLAGCYDQEDAKKGLPQLVRSLSKAVVDCPPARRSWWHRLRDPHTTPSEPGMRLLVACWEREADYGGAFFISNDDELCGNFEPFTLYPIRNLASPAPDHGIWFDYEFDFEPMTDGARLAHCERGQPNEQGGYRVGGEFEAFRVHGGGIDRWTVCSWPDRVRKKIDPVVSQELDHAA